MGSAWALGEREAEAVFIIIIVFGGKCCNMNAIYVAQAVHIQEIEHSTFTLFD